MTTSNGRLFYVRTGKNRVLIGPNDGPTNYSVVITTCRRNYGDDGRLFEGVLYDGGVIIEAWRSRDLKWLVDWAGGQLRSLVA